MSIFGGILLILGVIFFFIARAQARRLHAMNAAETYTAHLLHTLHRKITTELGPELLAQPCEVNGTIVCDTPLEGPVSGQECVAYRYTRMREYETRLTETDSDGKRETSVERRSATLEDNERRVDFWVEDNTGRSLIRPASAEIDLVETANRFEDDPGAWSGGSRTLGYRHIERALPVGIQVYVLGCAVDYKEQPAIARGPGERQLRFLISRKSERELAGSAARWTQIWRYAAGILTAAGLLFVVLGFVI